MFARAPPVVMAATAALLVVALAGCAGGDKSSGTVVELADGTKVELSGGAIAGVVVDEAIRPLAGANVTVLGPQLTVATDASGVFNVPDLEPGLYTLSVVAAGYKAVQTTAEVVPEQTAKVRIVLPIDPTPRPYHTTYSFDWFDEVGVTLVDFAVDLVDRDFLNDSVPDQCDVCYFTFQTDGPVDTFVIEAVWTDTVQDVAEGSTEYFWTLDGKDSGEYQADYFESPGRAEVAAGALGNDTHFGIGMSADEDWITYQQQAKMFVTAFYLAPPPDGWSFVAGDT